MSRRDQFRVAVALAAILLPTMAVQGQPRPLRRAAANIINNSRQPSLLDQMFAPGGPGHANRGHASPFRPTHNRTSSFYGSSFRYLSNGSPYDPYQQASLINRYLDTPQPWAQPGNTGISSNMANVYAPASYQVPGMPSAAPPLQGGLVLPGATQAGMGGFSPGITQTNIGQPLSPSGPSVSEALWLAGRRQRESAPSTIGDRSPASLEMRPAAPPAAAVDQPQRHVDLALRDGSRAFQRGDFDQAREDYVKAIALGCMDTRARLGLGLAEFARGRYDDAALILQAELTAAPFLDRSVLDVRRAYGRPEEFDAQVSRLVAATASDPSAEHLFLLGYLRSYAGDRAGGADAWRHFLTHEDADPAAKAVVARLLNG